ncbi:succinylglutamate desuccinylase [Vibrio sp. 11986-1-5]|uniref:succinylglutamate desuccinylase n=1 Tax=Vibrio sp. 11986-1-5 TaxID=2211215 RepID=UPI000D731189|nr:succinylglutamate desuccinylase [Vibrio sp. 11986-1-5]EKO3687316.1 succinylglutamate desuccinylase [Vibrio metschnikovii]EKO3690746.1 succinylglutamate desuccinylase [Vibrio metschnikovii]EKO3693446.1 succinylglutamate desuccinylase [Vibrio metschnikovii]EKO3779059.1 succinylglutamate desuccinylase [Vibrio metschnikovii]EKO3886647.1 succinylglutamate desuccinylase [Vibrio metschnikovii]
MTTSLFRRSFLFDSLDIDQPMPSGEITTQAGVRLKLWQRGVLEVLPAHYSADSKNMVISCGVHGDETAPMELVDKLIDDIVSGFQRVQQRCLFIIAHPKATLRHTRFIEENLNRLFDDKPHAASLEADIANQLKTQISQFFAQTAPETRWHLDLHCAIRLSKHYSFAVSPKTRHPVRSRALMEFIESAHIEAVMLSNAPASTFSWFSAEHFAAQAMTVELGQVAKLGENDLARLAAFDLALRDLVAAEKSEHLAKKTTMYRVSRTIVRLHEDFDFRFGDDVENFTSFMHGEVFGHDGDKPLMAKNEGEAIVFPNRKVAIGQRAALMVCKVDTRYEDDQLVYD